MKRSNKNALIMAAVAGMAMGAGAPSLHAEDNATEVHCYGINGCGAHAKCSVKAEDLTAVRTLLGDKEYRTRFGKSSAHSCGAHAKCGSENKVLNWIPASGAECREKGGFVVEEAGGKKVAKKA